MRTKLIVHIVYLKELICETLKNLHFSRFFGQNLVFLKPLQPNTVKGYRLSPDGDAKKGLEYYFS